MPGGPASRAVIGVCARLLECGSVSSRPIVFAGEGPQCPRNARLCLSLLPTECESSVSLMILNLTPCPLVIPEPMFSGLPVLLSDAVIGRLEMIDPGESGYPVI